MQTPIPPGAPLAARANGAPIVYPALGAVFHLESLLPDDEPRLDAALDELRALLGDALRWTLSSSFGVVQPFRKEDLDFISSYPTTLDAPSGEELDDLDEEEEDIARHVAGLFRTEFGMAFHGGARRNEASPYSLRFYSVVADGAGATPETLPTCSMLRVTVPVSFPLVDFCKRVCLAADHLRLRWGAAGLMFSGWEVGEGFDLYTEAVYATARRHWGYDVGEYVHLMQEWHDQVRTVNWLTFLGRSLLETLKTRGGRLMSSRHVEVSDRGDVLVLRAGEQPEEGDINRLTITEAYREADGLVRPIRAGAGLRFAPPWDNRTTEEWLRRFERRGPAEGPP